MRVRVRTRGSYTLYMPLLILPFFLAMASLTLELEGYWQTTERLQRDLDTRLLAADQGLTAPPDVERSFGTRLDRSQRQRPRSEVSFMNDRLRGIESDRYDPKFFGLLSPNLALQRRTAAVAARPPLDLLLLLDSGSYLAPLPGEPAWGPDDQYPAASALRDARWREIFMGADKELLSVAQARGVTQRCFSPPLLALKQIAVRLFDLVGSRKTDRVGIGFFPGLRQALWISGFTGDETAPGFISQPLLSEMFLDATGGDLRCAFLAEGERSIQQYRYPPLIVESELGARQFELLDDSGIRFKKDLSIAISGRSLLWTRAGAGAVAPSQVPIGPAAIALLSRPPASATSAREVYRQRLIVVLTARRLSGDRTADALETSADIKAGHQDIARQLPVEISAGSSLSIVEVRLEVNPSLWGGAPFLEADSRSEPVRIRSQFGPLTLDTMTYPLAAAEDGESVVTAAVQHVETALLPNALLR